LIQNQLISLIRYSQACTRAVESVLDQEEKEGVELKIDDYDNFGWG
jgi:hypothetical protein